MLGDTQPLLEFLEIGCGLGWPIGDASLRRNEFFRLLQALRSGEMGVSCSDQRIGRLSLSRTIASWLSVLVRDHIEVISLKCNRPTTGPIGAM